MNNRYLRASLAEPPGTYRNLMAAIPESRWDEPSGDNRFTPREIIAHLADCEEMFQNRLRAAIYQPGSTVELFDEERRSVDLHYAGADVAHQLDLFAERRKATLEFIETVNDWSGGIVHPEQGEMTAQDVVYTMAGHDAYHIGQLSAYLVD